MFFSGLCSSIKLFCNSTAEDAGQRITATSILSGSNVCPAVLPFHRWKCRSKVFFKRPV